MTDPTLGQALLQALRGHGVRELFGIPGDFVLPFFKTIEESGTLPLYTLSHEPAVGFAADAAARIHGGLSVAVATWGAGAFNLVGRPARGDRPGGGLGRAAAAGRDFVGHQLRRQRAQDRHASRHSRHRPRGAGGAPHLPRHPDGPAARRAAGARRGPKGRAAARLSARTLPAPPGRGRVAHCAQRHRHRGERPVPRTRPAADRRRHGRLPVHRHGDPEHRAGRAGVLCRHGLWRAGGARHVCRRRGQAP